MTEEERRMDTDAYIISSEERRGIMNFMVDGKGMGHLFSASV